MIRLATYINRANSPKTTIETPEKWKMPAGKEIDIKETDADLEQYGLINNLISGNEVNTTFDFISSTSRVPWQLWVWQS